MAVVEEDDAGNVDAAPLSNPAGAGVVVDDDGAPRHLLAAQGQGNGEAAATIVSGASSRSKGNVRQRSNGG